jgi:hypothetical protein
MFARERLDSFIRSRWRRLLLLTGAAVVGSALFWLLIPASPGFRGFIAGLLLAATAASLWNWCVMASGASNATMGEAAEMWTSSELRRLRRRNWRHLDHLVLRPPGDIDHVAIGPDGVIVIETKWRSIATDLSRDSKWLADAAQQVRRNERDLARHLGWGAKQDARITSLLVVWGPEITQQGDGPQDGPDGVNVVSGQHLRTVLGDLSESHLDRDETERIYRKLAEQMDRTDRWAADSSSPRPPTLMDTANEWAARLGSFVLSFMVTVSCLTLGWWAFPALGLVLAAPVLAGRVSLVRSARPAWWAGAVVALGAIAFALVMNIATA